MPKRYSGGDDAPEPDMTPMIDCVFQLITFFMLVMNFENMEADERVKLPVSDIAKPPKVKLEDELVLNVGFIRNQDGAKIDQTPYVFYAGEKITVSDMGPRLQREMQRYKLKHSGDGETKTTVVIRADGETPTGQVQELIKLCQDNKYTRFALKAMENVDQKPAP